MLNNERISIRALAHRLSVNIIVLTLLLGCMPLKQYHVTGGEQYDHFGYHNGYGLLKIGPSNIAKTVSLVDAESFAVGPRGKRYSIKSEPHPYDLEKPGSRSPYVRDRIYLIDKNGKKISNWRNGQWQFTFVLDTPQGQINRHFTMTLGTFYYNPATHGPPN